MQLSGYPVVTRFAYRKASTTRGSEAFCAHYPGSLKKCPDSPWNMAWNPYKHWLSGYPGILPLKGPNHRIVVSPTRALAHSAAIFTRPPRNAAERWGNRAGVRYRKCQLDKLTKPIKVFGIRSYKLYDDRCRPRKAHVIQVYDSPVSKARLEADNAVASDIRSASVAMAYSHSVGLCGPLSLTEKHMEMLEEGGVIEAHYGGLRGLDKMRDAEVGIVVGRNQPGPFGVEEIARAIWPYEELKLPGDFIQRPSGYTMRGGEKQGVLIHDHPDPRCRSVLRQIREAETIQAIDRHRLIYRDSDKPIFLLSNLPVPIVVDEVVRLRDVIGYKHLATLMVKHGGVLPLSADWLLAYGGKHQTRNAASHWSKRVSRSLQCSVKGAKTLKAFKGAKTYIYIIRKWPL